ncbi:uncharacterized protein LOC122815863 [Protopterus annectens]|uniref:uncharacterized protein LOC122815863 n=1 Tax=Protopterus annectens TaxID=7888 RepID=UPI001CFB7FB2|nr:uncharacterized protein LOC122815863 [Protopterus annectens]
MALLTILLMSYYFLSAAEGEKLEKPSIRIITEGSAHIDSRVTIECSSSRDTLTGCVFYRNHGNPALHLPNPGTQYVIERAKEEHEGFYTCECYNSANEYTETSFRVPLILNEMSNSKSSHSETSLKKEVQLMSATLRELSVKMDRLTDNLENLKVNCQKQTDFLNEILQQQQSKILDMETSLSDIDERLKKDETHCESLLQQNTWLIKYHKIE